MAAAILLPADAAPPRALTPPIDDSPHLALNTSSPYQAINGTPTPVPNKHIPYCSPGPKPPAHGIPSPPSSPPKDYEIPLASTLHPPDARYRIPGSNPPVYAISAATFAEAIDGVASRPLPDPKNVFPWLHGLHADNQLQLSFFVQRRRHLRLTPKCLRSLTIVKAGGDLSYAKVKGAISPDEILTSVRRLDGSREFLDIDPKAGFSVRNFQIQACKLAFVSDIIVYGDDDTPRHEVERLGRQLALAQRIYSEKVEHVRPGSEPMYNTFVVTDPFAKFEESYPGLVATAANGTFTGRIIEFPHQERIEMHSMSEATEISQNIWLGPTPDVSTFGYELLASELARFDILVEGSDFARMPEAAALADVENFLRHNRHERAVTQLDFPASGSMPAYPFSRNDANGVMRMLHWLYKMANPSDQTADHRVLLHCTDGYTETSLLAIAYLMFAECLSVHEAWIRLHREKRRNFFAYPSDKAILETLELRIMQESPNRKDTIVDRVSPPSWMAQMDGSLPSRILPYLYLGNLGHASNHGLLKELGITRVLSVGEPIAWQDEELKAWGLENFLYIDRVQDNGVDSLTDEFSRCLAFIEQSKNEGHATLVHCRVGVSRSATICIAEVMKEKQLSFARAYCFVRARRLNVIIQPHLRFVYELLKWEEDQCRSRGQPLRRELEWATVAREIALMNQPYCRG